ncbi:MAG: LuxR family transcriptional regulator, partial [Candidatus Limnocylindria bacterium]
MTTTQTIPPAEALIQAREAAARHRWLEALELFSAADAANALTPGDLDLLGDAAWWTGDMTAAIAAQERAYAGHSAAGDSSSAARTALQLASEYNHRLESAVATGWVSRAQRLLEGTPEAHAHGLLERARRNAALNRGDLEEALEHANRVFEIGTRLGDRDLIGLGMEDKGAVLVQLGRV